MGANSSKENQRTSNIQSIHFKSKSPEQVDFGTVFPNGLYSTAPQDYDARILRQFIIARKLSPFYKGLADAPEPVAADSVHTHSPLLAATTQPSPSSSSLTRLQASASLSSLVPPTTPQTGRPRSASNRSEKISKHKEKELQAERKKLQEAMLYNDAVECPICFLYYPPNINYSRCCDQPICTECFIQIHRSTDDPTHPATCPFCLENNYGVIYHPPSWTDKPKNRLRSLSSSSSISTTSLPSPTSPSGGARHTTSGLSQGSTPRRKSISHTHPDVVLIDHIRPNWSKPSPTATRSSRRNSLSNNNSSSNTGRPFLRAMTRPGRSSSSAASNEYHQYLATVRDMTMDLEEYMILQAIQESLQSHEQEEGRRQTEGETASDSSADPSQQGPDSSAETSPDPAHQDRTSPSVPMTSHTDSQPASSSSSTTSSDDSSSASSSSLNANANRKSDSHLPLSSANVVM
ncbi:hypothetical protein DM01DRAFT_1310911 [Hesseltinella vesiculosa]|uniref:RING-type domain-containing protein n=1 Tax=Hesseltinella vesiculosa TaxID=101127 RepID=A0A1X2G778_9FUNG|nr:hypothetical protein DM01DRAFT_1310911 [Hesseltinella vesiculosa]